MACQNGGTRIAEVFEKTGAGEGNRTLVISLEGARRASTLNGFSDKLAPSATLRHKANFSLSERREGAW
jgi:hypothetical protein